MQLCNKTTNTRNLEAKHINKCKNLQYNNTHNDNIFIWKHTVPFNYINNVYMQNFFDYSPDGTALNHSFKLNINNQVLKYWKNTHFILKYLVKCLRKHHICLDCITVIRPECILDFSTWWQQWQRLLDSLA